MRNSKKSLMTWGLAMALPTIGNGQVVTDVAVKPFDKGLEVTISGQKLAKPKLLKLSEGRVLMLEFSAGYQGKRKKLAVNHGGVKEINAGWFSAKPKKARVQIKLDEAADAQISAKDGQWVVLFGSTETGTESVATTTPTISEPFPETVPAISELPPVGTKPPKSEIREAMVVAGSEGQTPAPTRKNERKISLDFVSTDVVQILKALALQAKVNIVTSPDVKGTVTVNLDNVSVDEALRLVTSIAGLQYSQMAGAYVVAPIDKIGGIVGQLTSSGDAAQTPSGSKLLETRVIDVYSGEAAAIRAALIRSLGQGELAGFDILLPSDSFAISRKAAEAAAPGTKPTGDTTTVDSKANVAGQVAGGALESKSATDTDVAFRGLKDQYLIVIGPKRGMVEVAAKINELDKAVLKSYGIKPGEKPDLVRHMYKVQSGVAAADLVKIISSTADDNRLNVDLYASPRAFVNQLIVIVGRGNSVDRAEKMIREIDISGYGNELKVYEVKYGDPRALREALVSQVQGIRATLAPPAAGTPGIFVEGKLRQQANDVTTNGGLGAGGTTGGNALGVNSNSVVDDATLEQPYLESERAAVPMRLVLRGTKDQIAEALAYLAQVDIAPKQIAIELRVMELTKEDAIKAGIDWNIVTGGAVQFLRFNNAQPGPDAPANSGKLNIGGRNWGGSVTASLDKISTKNNLIARPNLLALDGRNSEIFVGDIVRYIETISVSQNGPTITTGRIPVGVRMTFLPRIGADGTITLDLRPRTSILTSFTPVPGGGQLPQTSTRFAQTTLAMESGETIAIGGLIQDQDRRTVQGLPILMDLPILGQLFRRTSNTRTRSEIVIFLTAKTINGPVHAADRVLPMQKDSKLGGG